VFKSQSFVPIL